MVPFFTMCFDSDAVFAMIGTRASSREVPESRETTRARGVDKNHGLARPVIQAIQAGDTGNTGGNTGNTGTCNTGNTGSEYRQYRQ